MANSLGLKDVLDKNTKSISSKITPYKSPFQKFEGGVSVPYKSKEAKKENENIIKEKNKPKFEIDDETLKSIYKKPDTTTPKFELSEEDKEKYSSQPMDEETQKAMRGEGIYGEHMGQETFLEGIGRKSVSGLTFGVYDIYDVIYGKDSETHKIAEKKMESIGMRTTNKSGQFVGEFASAAIPFGAISKGIGAGVAAVPKLAKYATAFPTLYKYGAQNLAEQLVETGIRKGTGQEYGAGDFLRDMAFNTVFTGVGDGISHISKDAFSGLTYSQIEKINSKLARADLKGATNEELFNSIKDIDLGKGKKVEDIYIDLKNKSVATNAETAFFGAKASNIPNLKENIGGKIIPNEKIVDAWASKTDTKLNPKANSILTTFLDAIDSHIVKENNRISTSSFDINNIEGSIKDMDNKAAIIKENILNSVRGTDVKPKDLEDMIETQLKENGFPKLKDIKDVKLSEEQFGKLYTHMDENTDDLALSELLKTYSDIKDGKDIMSKKAFDDEWKAKFRGELKDTSLSTIEKKYLLSEYGRLIAEGKDTTTSFTKVKDIALQMENKKYIAELEVDLDTKRKDIIADIKANAGNRFKEDTAEAYSSVISSNTSVLNNISTKELKELKDRFIKKSTSTDKRIEALADLQVDAYQKAYSNLKNKLDTSFKEVVKKNKAGRIKGISNDVYEEIVSLGIDAEKAAKNMDLQKMDDLYNLMKEIKGEGIIEFVENKLQRDNAIKETGASIATELTNKGKLIDKTKQDTNVAPIGKEFIQGFEQGYKRINQLFGDTGVKLFGRVREGVAKMEVLKNQKSNIAEKVFASLNKSSVSQQEITAYLISQQTKRLPDGSISNVGRNSVLNSQTFVNQQGRIVTDIGLSDAKELVSKGILRQIDSSDIEMIGKLIEADKGLSASLKEFRTFADTIGSSTEEVAKKLHNIPSFTIDNYVPLSYRFIDKSKIGDFSTEVDVNGNLRTHSTPSSQFEKMRVDMKGKEYVLDLNLANMMDRFNSHIRFVGVAEPLSTLEASLNKSKQLLEGKWVDNVDNKFINDFLENAAGNNKSDKTSFDSVADALVNLSYYKNMGIGSAVKQYGSYVDALGYVDSKNLIKARAFNFNNNIDELSNSLKIDTIYGGEFSAKQIGESAENISSKNIVSKAKGVSSRIMNTSLALIQKADSQVRRDVWMAGLMDFWKKEGKTISTMGDIKELQQSALWEDSVLYANNIKDSVMGSMGQLDKAENLSKGLGRVTIGVLSKTNYNRLTNAIDDSVNLIKGKDKKENAKKVIMGSLGNIYNAAITGLKSGALYGLGATGYNSMEDMKRDGKVDIKSMTYWALKSAGMGYVPFMIKDSSDDVLTTIVDTASNVMSGQPVGPIQRDYKKFVNDVKNSDENTRLFKQISSLIRFASPKDITDVIDMANQTGLPGKEKGIITTTSKGERAGRLRLQESKDLKTNLNDILEKDGKDSDKYARSYKEYFDFKEKYKKEIGDGKKFDKLAKDVEDYNKQEEKKLKDNLKSQ